MKSRLIAYHFSVKNPQGKVLDTSRGGEPILHLVGWSHMLPVLETTLNAMKAGESKNLDVKSADGYGARDEKLVIEVPLDSLPTNPVVKEGARYRLQRQGEPNREYRVLKVKGSHAVLDGNHPLAGMDLLFELEVKEIRETTLDEASALSEMGPRSKMSH